MSKETSELDVIMEHLRDSVEDGDWFEINPDSARVLLDYLKREGRIIPPREKKLEGLTL